MDDAKKAWNDVASQVEGLGLKLKLHLEQEADGATDRPEGSTRSAFDDLTAKVTDAFDAFGNAARDQAVHSDMRDLAQSMQAALVKTFQSVGAELGDLMGNLEGYAEGAAEKISGSMGLDGSADADADAEGGSADGDVADTPADESDV